MKKMSEDKVALEAFNKKLETPLPYSYSWEAYETPAEMKAAGDGLSDEEQMKTRNNQRQANARSKSYNAALEVAKIFKPTAENDPQIALKDMVKTLLTSKLEDGSRRYTEAQAREIAETTYGVKWQD